MKILIYLKDKLEVVICLIELFIIVHLQKLISPAVFNV